MYSAEVYVWSEEANQEVLISLAWSGFKGSLEMPADPVEATVLTEGVELTESMYDKALYYFEELLTEKEYGYDRY